MSQVSMPTIVRPSIHPVPPMRQFSKSRPKRARSDSISSSSSSSGGSSYNDGSIFSQENEHSESSSSQSSAVDSDSNCSSPELSKHTSPCIVRPAKVCRRNSNGGTGPKVQEDDDWQRGTSSQPDSKHISQDDVALANLQQHCTLASGKFVKPEVQSADDTASASSSATTTPQPAAGRTVFVDCLVDASVHVLDMIWHAPVRKAIAYLSSAADATCIQDFEYTPVARSCRCPVGMPFSNGVSLNVFIRETLRRSRTSCSTLQAALLYCKRVGSEVVRKRAEFEGIILSDEDLACLAKVARPHIPHDAEPKHFPSLTDGLDGSSVRVHPLAQTNDPLLCGRRTFLAAVVVSSKFLQDRTYSNRAWSKISGLDVRELCGVERRMLDALSFNLAATDEEWARWVRYLSRGEWRSSLDSCRCRDAEQDVDRTSTLSASL